ncbi:MAG: dihydrofolate reductase [Spirochaetaceae bacterium]|nr:dihydrofolate reductase [Spirochaetaceae bacterium]
MSNIVYIATSLDGYIARKDGSIDWLREIPNPHNSDFGFNEFMEGVDAIIMGRNTFETVLSFNEWPYSKPVFVLSRSMKSLPSGYACKAEIVQGDLKLLIESLNRNGLKTLYIDGGKTIQSFLELHLIDEFFITRLPVLLGSGISLFAESPVELKLEHIKTEVINNYLVKSHYRRNC